MAASINHLKQMTRAGLIKVQQVETEEQVADALTKSLPSTLFHKHRDKMVRHIDREL
jgi:hypothetical protein